MFYNNQNEQRKRELQNAYKDSLQMQEYSRNKQNIFDKTGSALGKLRGGYADYKAGSNLFSKDGGGFAGKYAQGISDKLGANFGNKFGGDIAGKIQGINGADSAGALGGAGGALTAAQGALSVGGDLQRGDYTNAGLDAAKTAASFFGPWGMAASAAISAYQGIKAKQQQKAQKAAMKGMEKLQETTEEADSKKAQAAQAIEQQNQQDDMAVEAMANQPVNDLKQDMATQVFYPQYQPVNIQEKQLNAQPVYTETNSQMSSSPVAQEIMTQVQNNQQPNYSNQNSLYSTSEIEEELRRRGAL